MLSESILTSRAASSEKFRGLESLLAKIMTSLICIQPWYATFLLDQQCYHRLFCKNH